MNNQLFNDWSDVAWFVIGVLILGALYYAFLCYFEVKNQETLTETERNKRMMDSIQHDCSYDVSHEHYYGD